MRRTRPKPGSASAAGATVTSSSNQLTLASSGLQGHLRKVAPRSHPSSTVEVVSVSASCLIWDPDPKIGGDRLLRHRLSLSEPGRRSIGGGAARCQWFFLKVTGVVIHAGRGRSHRLSTRRPRRRGPEPSRSPMPHGPGGIGRPVSGIRRRPVREAGDKCLASRP
jgi:hypothetical protein